MPIETRGQAADPSIGQDPGSASDAIALSILIRVQSILLPSWSEENAQATQIYLREREAKLIWHPKVMVGTLHTNEQEFETNRASVEKQDYDALTHVVISGMAKRQAHDELYRRFLGSDHDLLIKLDADMVLLDEQFVTRVVDAFRWDSELAMLQISIRDGFTGQEMQGINTYSRALVWDSSAQDPLFTDRTSTRKEQRRVVWATFHHSVVHAPDPSDLQAFHFGVHRALKVRAATHDEADLPRAREHLMYLERTYERSRESPERRLLLAALGAELTLHGTFDIADLDYPTPRLVDEVEKLGRVAVAELCRRVEELRARPVEDAAIEGLRRSRRSIDRHRRVERVVLLSPDSGHTAAAVRSFQLAAALQRHRVEAVVALPDTNHGSQGSDVTPRSADFADVPTTPLSQALDQSWDVASCSDATSGLMCVLPWLDATVTAVDLVHDWRQRHLYSVQIDLVVPDLVLATSDDVAAVYPDRCPMVVPSGLGPSSVDHDVPDLGRAFLDVFAVTRFDPEVRALRNRRARRRIEELLAARTPEEPHP